LTLFRSPLSLQHGCQSLFSSSCCKIAPPPLKAGVNSHDNVPGAITHVYRLQCRIAAETFLPDCHSLLFLSLPLKLNVLPQDADTGLQLMHTWGSIFDSMCKFPTMPCTRYCSRTRANSTLCQPLMLAATCLLPHKQTQQFLLCFSTS
jgi:hypothetical protein